MQIMFNSGYSRRCAATNSGASFEDEQRELGHSCAEQTMFKNIMDDKDAQSSCSGSPSHVSNSNCSKQHRHSPYSVPAGHKRCWHPAHSNSTSTVQQQQAAAQTRCKMLLEMAISLANSSLHATVQHFNSACSADAGSGAALSALDAAEAAMAQATRMTSLASALATRMLKSSNSQAGISSPAGIGAATPPALQQVLAMHQLLMGPMQQQLQQQADAGLAATAAAKQARYRQIEQDKDEEEDSEEEEGETVSSTFRSDSLLPPSQGHVLY